MTGENTLPGVWKRHLGIAREVLGLVRCDGPLLAVGLEGVDLRRWQSSVQMREQVWLVLSRHKWRRLR